MNLISFELDLYDKWHMMYVCWRTSFDYRYHNFYYAQLTMPINSCYFSNLKEGKQRLKEKESVCVCVCAGESYIGHFNLDLDLDLDLYL